VFPDDLLTYYREWDRMVKECIPHIYAVKQPLLSVLPPETIEELEELKKDPAKMRSLRECHYARKTAASNGL